MKMVPHDAVRKNSHRDPTGGLGNREEESLEVAWFVKQRFAVVAAIENVLHKTIW